MSNDPLKRLRKRKRPAEKRVEICMDSRFQQAIEDAQLKVSQLERKADLHRRNRSDANPLLADELQDAYDELETAKLAGAGHMEEFVAKAIAPRRYDDLIELHPPTKEQQKEHRREFPNQSLRWNPETFPPALITSCVYLVTKTGQVDPDTGKQVEDHTLLTDEFVKEMFEGGEDDAQWNVGETTALTEAAIDANHRGPRRVAALGNA